MKESNNVNMNVSEMMDDAILINGVFYDVSTGEEYEENDMSAFNERQRLILKSEICRCVDNLFDEYPLDSITLGDVENEFGSFDSYTLEVIEEVLNELVDENKLVENDGYYYLPYPSIYNCLKFLNNDKEETVLRRRLMSDTLQAIADDFGVTRVYIRDVQIRAIRKLNRVLCMHTDYDTFMEERYAHICSQYNFSDELWDYLGITPETRGYVNLFQYGRGKKTLEEALDDKFIPAELIGKIKSYLNRNKVFYGGQIITKNVADIERFAVEKYCIESTDMDAIPEVYDKVLNLLGVEDEPKLQYTNFNIRGRIGRLCATKFVVCTFGKKFRFYDMESKDFTELYDALKLDCYNDTEISSGKLYRDNLELMSKYDIRDGYELHNVLRKTLPENLRSSVKFGKMPAVVFGNYNRLKAYEEILRENGPLTCSELISIIYDRYGYDKTSIPVSSEFYALRKYYADGVYKI